MYFSVVLFIIIMLYKVVLTFASVDEILKRDHSIKATEQYFPVVLFIMLYKVVLTFESVHEILWCDHSNKSYSAVIPMALFIMLHGNAVYLYVWYWFHTSFQPKLAATFMI